MRLWNIYHPEIPDFLTEAADAPAMLRLQNVGMNCGCEYTNFPDFAHLAPYSRFDHSMGVALIVWHFTQNSAQAMSGLLHDIATPTFAHVVDFLHGDHMTQESTESATSAMIRADANLCATLERRQLPFEAVEDYHRYPIADNDSPKLSADRLEYTLGNGVNFGLITKAQAAALYADLTVGTNESGQTELVFRTPDIGLRFAQTALKCSEIYISDADRYAMQILSELLKQAIDGGILEEADLWQQESAVIAKLQDSALSGQWQRFCGLSQMLRQDAPGSDGTWRQIFAKKRCIDPYVQGHGRVSALFPDFGRQLTAFRQRPLTDWLSAK